MAWALWVGGGIGTVGRERSRLDPSSCAQADRIAVLGRLRVERSAAGSGPSVIGSVSSGCRGNTVGGLGSVHWREERISLLRFGYRTAYDVTGRHRGVGRAAMADLAGA